MIESINKKFLLLLALAAVILLALGLYLLLRGRVTPPTVVSPIAPPPVERPVTFEDKMQVLQRLSATPVPAAERKNILRMLQR